MKNLIIVRHAKSSWEYQNIGDIDRPLKKRGINDAHLMSKVLAKKIMQFNNLPTADFFSINEFQKLNLSKTYIAKPIWEEASVGISEDYIFNLSETAKIKKIQQLSNTHYFIEEFIDGREINISMLANKDEVEVLPPAEIIFSDYFNNKPKIVGYAAKWDENSEEYKQTNRAYGTLETNPELMQKLIDDRVDGIITDRPDVLRSILPRG